MQQPRGASVTSRGRNLWVVAALALLLAPPVIGAGFDILELDASAGGQAPAASTGDPSDAATAPAASAPETVRSTSILPAPGAPTYVPAASVGWGASMADQELVIECPPADPTVVMRPDKDTIVERTGCPFRIIDGADLLGSPALAVDPRDPNRIVFFSLHGCATDQGANPWSRVGGSCTPSASSQTHTTFTSLNEGREWLDQPHGNAGFGEAAHGLVDREGRIYISHLFSNRIGSAPDGEALFKYHIHLYKEQDWSLNYYSKEIPTRADGNKVEHVNLALVTPWQRIENLRQYNETRNETVAAPSDDDDVGNFTETRAMEHTDDDLVAAIWHERAYDWQNSSTGKSSWIGVAWTDTSSRNDWTLLPKEQLVGPCRHASNGAAWNGRIYVACSVDAGYDGRRGARIGDVDIWAIDPTGNEGRGSKEFISKAVSVSDGELKIDFNNDGMMALTSLKPSGDGPTYSAVEIDVAFAWYGRHFVTTGMGAGPLLHGAWNIDFREARITAMEVLDGPRPTLYMTYMERSNETTTGTVDPDNPLAASDGVIEYHKSVSTWEPCGSGLNALHDLQIGVVRHPFDEGLVNEFTGAFDDYQDGLAQAIDPTGVPYVYFTWGDHGVIQYGKIIATSGSAACPIPAAPPLFIPPPPVPVALVGSSGIGVGVATMMAAPATAMFAYLLVAKRRMALAAITKAK